MGRSTTVVASSATLFLLILHHYIFSRHMKVLEWNNDAIVPKSNGFMQDVDSQSNNFLNSVGIDHFDTEKEDIVDVSRGTISIDDITPVPYVHCGPSYYRRTKDATNPKELLLLHGARYTKETWVDSNILPTLCSLDQQLSVTAVDLSVSATVDELSVLFQGLVKEEILSGKPIVIVSPSASGKSILSMLDTSTNKNDSQVITKILRGWIPVGCSGIIHTQDYVLEQINSKRIPVLAIHGNLDSIGKSTSEKLREIGGSYVTVMEMSGGHPVYLDDSAKFINFVILFVNDLANVKE